MIYKWSPCLSPVGGYRVSSVDLSWRIAKHTEHVRQGFETLGPEIRLSVKIQAAVPRGTQAAI